MNYNIKNLQHKGPTYHDENEILFCEECGCDDFSSHDIGYEENIVSEKEYRCRECDNIVNFWAYGNFYNLKSEKYLIEEQKRLRLKKINNLM